MELSLTGAVCAFVFGVLGAWWGYRLARELDEDAVWQDHRVSELRKCAIVARIRGCPVERVIAERDALRVS